MLHKGHRRKVHLSTSTSLRALLVLAVAASGCEWLAGIKDRKVSDGSVLGRDANSNLGDGAATGGSTGTGGVYGGDGGIDTGGATGTGGVTGAGGAATSDAGSGGVIGTGGVDASVVTGGMTGTGGVTRAGGAGSGGVTGTGGAAPIDAGSGGVTGTGGAGTGGASGGSGGIATGGSGGTTPVDASTLDDAGGSSDGTAVVDSPAGGDVDSAVVRNCIAPPSGIVAWWTADQTLADAVGSHDLSVGGGSVGFTSGMVGYAFNITKGPFLETPDAPDLDLQDDFTIEAWIRMRTPDDPLGGRIVSKSTDGLLDGFFFDTYQQKIRLDCRQINVSGTTDLPVGEWVHVAGVSRGDTVAVYLNGVIDGIATSSSSTPVNTYGLRIGASQSGISNFDGQIDEVTIYHRALSTAEILAIAQAGSDGKCRPTSRDGGPATGGTGGTGGLTGAGGAGAGGADTGSSGSGGAGTGGVATGGSATGGAPTVGLVGEWLFDQGDARDTSGNALDGTINGATPTADRSGRPSHAFHFDGLSQSITVTSAPALHFGGDHSISAWIRPAGFSAMAGIVSKYQNWTPGGFMLRFGAGAPYDTLDFDQNGTSSPKVIANQWQHVGAVMQSGRVSIYLQGSLILRTTSAFNPPANDDFLGIGVDYSTRFYYGDIDEVRLYNRALTDAEMAALASQ